MRDNNWLQQLLDETWDNHFADVPQSNIVKIEFGRKAKNRLGSIKVDRIDREISIITMNGLFRSPKIPESIVKATIVHELSHYAHGFNSPLQQRFEHPHAGGVMRLEYKDRGLESLYVEQKRWLKDNWAGVIEQNFKPRAPRRASGAARAPKVPKPFWFGR